MFPIPDERIKILVFPEVSAASERQISRSRAWTFPGIEQLRERRGPNVNYYMDMIRHYHPRLQPIRLAILFAQLLFDERREVNAAKPAFAITPIEPSLEFATTFRVLRLVQNALPLPAPCSGKGVVQHERDELCDVRRVEMRKITSLVP